MLFLLLLGVNERCEMSKYLLKRILHGIFSVVVIVAIVMFLIYNVMDRQLIFAQDSQYTKKSSNDKIHYEYDKWEDYGYLDYVTYQDYVNELFTKGELDQDTRDIAAVIGRTAEKDSEITKKYIAEFTETYESLGYKVKRLDAKMLTSTKVDPNGRQRLFAYKDVPLLTRMWKFFSGIINVDTTSYIEENIENRGLTFTLYDPIYGGEKFSPAIIGNGTLHKYLLYFDNEFPYIHQNLITIKLGKSYSSEQGLDVFKRMTASQGAYVRSSVTYPTGYTEESADDFHTLTYVAGSSQMSFNSQRYLDDYTSPSVKKANMSRIGYSFVIGIIASLLAYLIGVPLGIMMAKRKDKLVDKLGTFYIIFILAVPSLAYIFMFQAIGNSVGLPRQFVMDKENWLMYVLPIISLALPSIANLMKWLRRYMIDQMNSDYVKFARSGGLSEGEIFSKHILKNAAIPIIHGIPGSILGALVGAIITERVYAVPGAGNLLTEAINKYDNAVIVGITLFYALLSIVSLILGDILMATVDPRISFTDKAR